MGANGTVRNCDWSLHLNILCRSKACGTWRALMFQRSLWPSSSGWGSPRVKWTASPWRRKYWDRSERRYPFTNKDGSNIADDLNLPVHRCENLTLFPSDYMPHTLPLDSLSRQESQGFSHENVISFATCSIQNYFHFAEQRGDGAWLVTAIGTGPVTAVLAEVLLSFSSVC